MYDIIGDIHGYAYELLRLLNHLGYVYEKKEKDNYTFSHPEGRQVIFVGDYIDRGPQNVQVYKLVRNMVHYGNAIALMGNHEFNFVCYHERDTKNGGYLRRHHLKNYKQIEETLLDINRNKQKDLLGEMLEWFKGLPLWFENDDFRVVHASWDEGIIEGLNKSWQGNRIPKDAWSECVVDYNSKKKGAFYEAVEVILKGREIEIPGDKKLSDADGNLRKNFRVKWWEEVKGMPLSKAAVKPLVVPEDPIIENTDFKPYGQDQKPVFVGHYWLEIKNEKEKSPRLRTSNVACLDYSVAKRGILVAYRYSGEQQLQNEGFEFVLCPEWP